ncbi:MAG: hypothetical protein WAN66_22345 [Limnoraphis robusta]|uniref:Uncharacterized protein n=1 Tax=Limnoraphis robusta CCNP1315 TaxID=3110306 RepID=A0ABU5TZ35_9CYAN|nr:hypothetical protein [Limnoraphis robusta]MEA5500184.1 hypothetical protein [Limnoraphis robusta BA-68 BA1]MEA5519921.1 hypothetical protein [Limnoraphis robusta CCNP1315]MEA5539701.1 hypothetical protein [Limnoraphis robusta Tam1]MEA5545161.1 hypothetical protein [Limnoraphis robusta CCNP1324]
MTALPLSRWELQNPQQLAELLTTAQTWKEIEALGKAYPDWKREAWELLSPEKREYIQQLKQWKDCPTAQKFPLGCTVERINSTQGLTGQVISYWSAYGVDYVMFRVGQDIDWCQAIFLKRVKADNQSSEN